MEYLSPVSIPTAQAGVITDATPLTSGLFNVLQFLLSIAGVVGIIGIVVAGSWYLTAGGDEERMKKAKRAVLACVIGLMVVIGALVIVTQIGRFFGSE